MKFCQNQCEGFPPTAFIAISKAKKVPAFIGIERSMHG